MRRLYWRLRIAFLALRWIPQLNLGDMVRFDDDVWVLVQGVNRPYWKLHHPGRGVVQVHKREFRKVWTLGNMWGSFRSGYHFYMTSWYCIWLREGIKPWVRGCDIWPWPRNKK